MGLVDPTQPAPAFSLNSVDWAKWRTDLIVFFAVPLVFYLTAVLGVIQLPDHVISVKDFIPNNTTIIAVVVYILNSLLSLLKKYIA